MAYMGAKVHLCHFEVMARKKRHAIAFLNQDRQRRDGKYPRPAIWWNFNAFLIHLPTLFISS